MTTPPRHLGLLEEVVQQLGLDVVDMHNDLVFVSHNQFILKIIDPINSFDIYFNEDIEEEKAQALMILMAGAAEAKGLTIAFKGAFCLTSKEDNQVELEFFNLSDA